MASNYNNISALSRGWGALSLLHERIQAYIERTLRAKHDLSVRVFSLLNLLCRQHNGAGGHLQMKQVADAVVLSQSAATRLVTRLEERGLLARCFCPTDRRGIYTNVSEKGFAILKDARPTYDAALHEALEETRRDQHLKPLMETLEALGNSQKWRENPDQTTGTSQ